MPKKKEQKYASQEKYDALNTRHYGIKLNLKTDSDIISVLDASPSKQTFIKNALRFYIAHSDSIPADRKM